MPKTVAIKELKRFGNDSDLIHEIAILSRINCPATIRYYGCFVNDTRIFIIMEKFGDCDGFNFIENQNPDAPTFHDLKSRLIVAKNMTVAVYNMHKCGIIHRDIKLENLLVDKKTLDIKFIDLGLSCMPDEMLPNKIAKGVGCDKRFVGTPDYMDPFLKNSRWQHTVRNQVMTDWYAYAHTLYILLTNKIYVKTKPVAFPDEIEPMFMTREYGPLANVLYALLRQNPANRIKNMGTGDTRIWAKDIGALIDQTIKELVDSFEHSYDDGDELDQTADTLPVSGAGGGGK